MHADTPKWLGWTGLRANHASKHGKQLSEAVRLMGDVDCESDPTGHRLLDNIVPRDDTVVGYYGGARIV